MAISATQPINIIHIWKPISISDKEAVHGERLNRLVENNIVQMFASVHENQAESVRIRQTWLLVSRVIQTVQVDWLLLEVAIFVNYVSQKVYEILLRYLTRVQVTLIAFLELVNLTITHQNVRKLRNVTLYCLVNFLDHSVITGEALLVLFTVW